MAAGTGGEFVDGWLVARVLGEGAYGEVRLLEHARSGAAVALKVVAGGAAGAREAALHAALRHAHVLRCLGARAHAGLHYLFLEYAQGGELFDRIEPDVGMEAGAARRYWRQLLAGLRYLHARGVAHRDIKPENLLLDHRDRLKISDFGMATLFRHGARERRLARVCGTAPYAAPEVLAAPARPYRAPPADLWAAALVLLAMLAGELPWERAVSSDARFVEWSALAEAPASTVPAHGPWRRLRGGARDLLRRALQPAPARRAALPELLRHAWTQAAPETETRAWRSQPAQAQAPEQELGPGAPAALSAAAMDALISYSQPAQPDELLGATPLERTPQGVERRLGRRATRVWAACAPDAALLAVGAACARRGHAARRVGERALQVECGGESRVRVWALPCGALTLVDFRRSRGCGLQFKRRFLELRDALAPFAVPAPDGVTGASGRGGGAARDVEMVP